jgi:hypothetical protein
MVAAGPRQRSHAQSTLSDERSGLSFAIFLLVSVRSQSVCTYDIYIRYLHYLCLTQFRDVYTIYTRPLSVQARYSISVCDIHEAFQIPNVYDYTTKSCRQQAEVIQNHENENVRCIGQGETRHRKYNMLKLCGGHVYDCSCD